MKSKWPITRCAGRKGPYLFPYANGVPKSWHEEIEREKLKLEKLKLEEPKHKVPLEPPTIVSKEELHRQAVRAGNRSHVRWKNSFDHATISTTDQTRPASGSHENSAGGMKSNLGDGNNWRRPHRMCE